MTATMNTIASHVQQDVIDELRWEPRVNPAHIGVSVEDGVVTLSGTIDSYLARFAAEKAAKRVFGVRGLVNRIEVRLPGSSERTDEDIAEAAINALTWNILVPSKAIKVTVDRGWVKLEGQVRWQFQRQAAERAVQGVKGIKGVVNRIVIKSTVQPQDLKTRIEDALRRSAEVDAQRVAVEVHGSTVILRGTVHSLAEREAAEQAAWSAPGVERVENLLEVKG